MVMLSELLRFEVVDREGRRARLDDLAFAVLDEDYPSATEVHVTTDAGLGFLPWDAVERIGPGRRLEVADLAAARNHEEGAPNGEVLLKHDILDALIIDLLNRRTTRANDLQLEEEDGALRLKAVDASFGAMIRRISRGVYGRVARQSLYDWQYVEFLRGDPNAVRNGAGYRMRISRLPAGEIAQMADYVPYLHAAELLKLLPDDKAADVLQAMSVERQRQVIEELDDGEASRLLERMSPDLAADLAGRLPIGMMKRLLGMIPRANSDLIVELLRYPENTVGGVMINNMIYFDAAATVLEAKERISTVLDDTDFVSLVFLVDGQNDRKLKGSVMLRDVLAGDDGQRLEDLMDPYLAVLDPFGPASEAAHRIVGAQLPAMPVVAENGRLVGAMTINAAIAQLLPASSSLQTLRVFS